MGTPQTTQSVERQLQDQLQALNALKRTHQLSDQAGSIPKVKRQLRGLSALVDLGRHPSPSEAIIDSQSVKSAAMVSKQVGFDGGKLIKGRKRFLTVDTLGLVLRVLVTAANVGEREGGKQVLTQVKQMGKRVGIADSGYEKQYARNFVSSILFFSNAGTVYFDWQ